MLLFQLERCIFHIQMRPLVTLNIRNKYHTKMKRSLHWIELKYNNLKNSSFSMYKLIHTNLERKEKESRLPSLMWHRGSVKPAPIASFLYSIFIRSTVDQDFRIFPFIAGATQAMSVISNALAAQNYEALNEFVDKRAIKVLKHRVDQLTPEQRRLIAIQPENSLIGIAKIQIIKTTDKNEVILQVTAVAMYSNSQPIDFLIPFYEIRNKLESMFKCAYVFQRRYRKGIGESWIAKLINHESF
ncbi:m-AAA protease-interacting protein 1, mitochondrial isoform X1 [Osmia lignaria lignaria]|uniref:m-AAA protease-interacting protein 1, mitochondrial isoform X1 n=2 Tax=Osmia lignaria lignaria TaxID=1437193 RepID=UPI001478641D|nr:uncharacterized protein LOC117600348 isoform X1 [Osmia lignaria]